MFMMKERAGQMDKKNKAWNSERKENNEFCKEKRDNSRNRNKNGEKDTRCILEKDRVWYHLVLVTSGPGGKTKFNDSFSS